MNQKRKLHLQFEFIWWLLTALIVTTILLPIYWVLKNDYPFYLINTLFIVVFITFTRYIFFLKHTFLAFRRIFKISIICFSPIIIFALINQMSYFQGFLDEKGIESIFTKQQNLALAKYIKSEMLLFGVGSVISAIALPFRFLISIWKNYNKR